VLAVAAVILGLQLIIAASRGISPPHAFPRLRGELVAFISLVAGYMGLYLEERLASNFRLLKAFAVNSALFAVVFGISSAVLHQNTAAPALAFLAGLAVRTLQNTSWRAFWFLGPAVPIAVACVNAGKLLSLESEPLSWPAVFIRWAGLTGACYLLTLLSRSHEAYYGARESSH
jgi:hypothetical protein